jgi:DNA-binding CsgD family transcriptional regulator
MSAGFQTLTEKEKQTLRLMGRGHDTKSMARHLGLSVHTINERLRAARQKLSVSSSREAARLLLETEGGTPQSFGDKEIGEAGPGADAAGEEASIDRRLGAVRSRRVIAGVLIMSLFIGIAALLLQPSSTAADQSAGAAAEQAQIVQSARDWLALVDAGRWEDSWRATGAQFRALNTVAVWTRVSLSARAPLGAVRSRVMLSEESVPAPPNGYEMVKFRTSFANRANATETVTLAHEDGTWKVVGCWIE